MAVIRGNFQADGDSSVIKNVKRFTILVGDTGASTFGGGTVAALISHDGVNFTDAGNSLTAEGVINSLEYTGGVVLKLNLSGATSPDLNYSIAYE